MKIVGTSEVVCCEKYLSLHAKSARLMKPYNHERCELIRIQPKGEWKIYEEWDVFTIRFYSRGIPFPGSHCGANRPSLSQAVHSFRSCRGRRASFLGRKNSNKSISNLTEALASRPEGWTYSILKEPCV